MVSRVWGKADGIEIMLEKGEEGRWTGLLPWSEDGEYIVELYAEDLAGNIGYYCTMLFTISGHELHGHIVPRGFAGTGDINDYKGFPDMDVFSGKIQEMSFCGNKPEEEYHAEVLEGGYRIERAVCCRNVC